MYTRIVINELRIHNFNQLINSFLVETWGPLGKPFQVSVAGKTQAFEPPSVDNLDPGYRRIEGAPIETMQLDWMYLFY